MLRMTVILLKTLLKENCLKQLYESSIKHVKSVKRVVQMFIACHANHTWKTNRKFAQRQMYIKETSENPYIWRGQAIPVWVQQFLRQFHRIWDEIKRHDLLRAQRINYYKDTSSPAPAYSNDQLYDFTGRVPVQKQYGDFAKMYFS